MFTKNDVKNTILVKERCFYVRENDVTKLVKLIQDVTGNNVVFVPSITCGNCCWGKTEDLFFVTSKLSIENYSKVCSKCVELNITLYPDTVGYTGYQTI